MTDETRYISPFSTRYASKTMQELFSSLHRAKLFRQLWYLLAKNERALGLDITEEQVEELKAHRDDVDLDACDRYERQTRHDVMAHIRAYADCCPKAAPIIHLGATSCYVGDNADTLIYREALELIRARLVNVVRALSDFAEKYADTPTLAYTHFQPAQPTTIGKRATLWINDLMMDIASLDHVRQILRPLGCKGTTGTQASFLELFHGDYKKVRALDLMIARDMGFDRSVPVSGQTYSRKMDTDILCLMGQIGSSAHKFAFDLRLLAHEKELEEPFASTQVGSSAMPYKRNPMRAERMSGLSRQLMVNVQNGFFTAGEQWLERSLDDSANRRISMSEGFLCADAVLLLYESIASGLVVHRKMAERHLMNELPFMMTENLMMRAVERGADRQQMHEIIRQHAMASGKRIKDDGLSCDLLERLTNDSAFPLTGDEIMAETQPERYIGCAREQTLSFLDECVKPLLESSGAGSADHAEIDL